MNKKILGLDLGTTSIGWAFVNESDIPGQSTIEKIGTRVIQYDTFSRIDKSGKVLESMNPEQDFSSGKGLSPNASRTQKRGARRNLDRYQLRRDKLVEVLKNHGFISDNTPLAETNINTTYSTYQLRAKAATEKISKEDLARVLLMINKKRGYKSSRKAQSEEEGHLIDGMAVTKRLYKENITPGQLSYQLLQEGKKYLPEFYRSDLQSELDKVWNFQKQFYPQILTNEMRIELNGKGRKQTWAICEAPFSISGIKRTTKGKDIKIENYKWRCHAISEQLDLEKLVIVLQEINHNINTSSGYLGAISDRSKELYFNNESVGQYLYKQLQSNPHTRTKGQVFYRQDYIDEFESIWESQSKYHSDLTSELKNEIQDTIIFYQRPLKSQKGLISFCEFESWEKEITIDGKKKIKTIGAKVTPKSSLLFQEFKIWQNLNNLLIQNKKTKESLSLNQESKQILFDELNIKGNLPKRQVLELLVNHPNNWDLNFNSIEGNRTNQVFYDAFLNILEYEGNDAIDKEKISAKELRSLVESFLTSLGINTAILDFNAELEGIEFEQQPSYHLWHILYSYQEDDSPTGNDHLYKLLDKKFGFKKEYAKFLTNITFQDNYGNLSAKAIRKIFPFIKEHKYNEACALAGYNHSSSRTKEENETRPLKERMVLLPKNSLRNPVVEKILNQMINVVNAIIADPMLGKPDEIRIELARELKKNAKERQEMTEGINKATEEHNKIRKILIIEDGIKNPSRNDIIRYRLYQELKNIGYKTLYSITYIPRENLFSKEFDIEHIIPKAKLFDDSFSNKTLEKRQVNINKGNYTALEFINKYYGPEGFKEYKNRLEILSKDISKAKYKKLLMKADEIGKGFIERDLRDSQYIAKKAKEILEKVCRTVVSTTGSVTKKLREDWGLINVMQELNLEKYKILGLTEMIEKKDGSFKEQIKDWTKRNDHRHHAMDALAIAFTKLNHIQYLNHLNARKDETNKFHSVIHKIEEKETFLYIDSEGKRKRKFKPPVENFREESKKHLKGVLVSFKARNKVFTSNKNRTKTKNGEKIKIELTPRGQLHKETIYGRLKQYSKKENEKIGTKFNEQTIAKVANKKYREALLQRLRENGNDPKKAFTGKNSLSKNPIYIDKEKKGTVPEKVKLVWLEKDYTIRKEVTPDLFKNSKKKDNFNKIIKTVFDKGVRDALINKYEDTKTIVEEFNQTVGNDKDKRKVLEEAFSNLEKNPIWLNKVKGIVIKRVTISGVINAEPLHCKKDHFGKHILDESGNKIPSDFVSTGNNHHVAIYRDEVGNLQEKVVSFFEAVERVNQGLPVVDKALNHDIGWKFLFTMRQNEMFIFPSEVFDPEEINLMDPKNNKLISPNLFRVQKIATKNYFFRHHLETTVGEVKALSGVAYKSQLGLNGIVSIVKVRINHLGQIVKIIYGTENGNMQNQALKSNVAEPEVTYRSKNRIKFYNSFEHAKEDEIKDILKLTPIQRLKNAVELILRTYQTTREELAARKPTNKITIIKSS